VKRVESREGGGVRQAQNGLTRSRECTFSLARRASASRLVVTARSRQERLCPSVVLVIERKERSSIMKTDSGKNMNMNRASGQKGGRITVKCVYSGGEIRIGIQSASNHVEPELSHRVRYHSFYMLLTLLGILGSNPIELCTGRNRR
jgi:hypothetical protein